MSKMRVLAVLMLTSIELLPAGAKAGDSNFVPKNGFVPDKATAVKIAEAVLVSIYGDEVLQQRPFKANLSGERWSVEGTFHQPKGEVRAGGVAYIEIKKMNGEILKVIHGK